MWEFIDKVIYINLDHREDRRKIMNTFFEKGNIPKDKIIRFPAIRRIAGYIGCIESHMQALQLAKDNKWKNVLILEDDLEWLNFEDGYKQLQELITLPKWDVIQLVGWYVKYDFPRIYETLNSGAYLVNEHYYDTLIANRRESLTKIRGVNSLFTGTIRYNADVYWNILAKTDNWYGIYPCMCRQVNTHSDISNFVYSASEVHGIFKAEDKAKFFRPIQNAKQ